jgi:hypothetical protein
MRYPRGFFSRIALAVDAPWQPAVVTPEGLQAKVAEIRGEWK